MPSLRETFRAHRGGGKAWEQNGSRKHDGVSDVIANPCRDWLRGSDLNRRPLGYEFGKGQVGNPLIFREKYSVIVSYTFPIHA